MANVEISQIDVIAAIATGKVARPGLLVARDLRPVAAVYEY